MLTGSLYWWVPTLHRECYPLSDRHIKKVECKVSCFPFSKKSVLEIRSLRLNHLPFACEASALTTEPPGPVVVEVTGMTIYTNNALGSVPTQYFSFSFVFHFIFSHTAPPPPPPTPFLTLFIPSSFFSFYLSFLLFTPLLFSLPPFYFYLDDTTLRSHYYISKYRDLPWNMVDQTASKSQQNWGRSETEELHLRRGSPLACREMCFVSSSFYCSRLRNGVLLLQKYSQRPV